MLIFRIVLVLAFALIFTDAIADDEAKSPAVPPALSVRVVAAGDRETTSALQQHILTLLSERQVHLSWERQLVILSDEVLSAGPSSDNVLANIWLDVTKSERALLYVENTRSERFLVRTLPLEAGYDELARESLANIVESAIDVLLQGGEIGVSREEAVRQVEARTKEESVQEEKLEPTPPSIKPSPPDPEKGGVEIAGFVSGGGDVVGDAPLFRAGPWVGAVVDGSPPARLRWFAWLQAGYVWGTPVSAEEVRIRSSGPQARLFGGVRFGRGALAGRLGLGGGVDVIQVSPEVRDDSFLGSGRFWTVSPVISLLGSAQWDFSKRVFGFMGLGGDFALVSHRLEVADVETKVVLAPYRVRPSAQLGLGFSFGK